MAATGRRCKTLDATGDGYGRSEACSLLSIRAVDLAQPNQLPTALIYGHAVNQDGRSSSLTAPNGPSQQALIRDAYCSVGATPATCVSAKLHGTGTALGDPIEIGAAAAAYGNASSDDCLAMTADKSGLGHAEPVAGAVAVLTGISSLLDCKLSPMVHLRTTNPHVEQVFATRTLGLRVPMIPKQACSLPRASSSPDCSFWGVSGFAFQVCTLLQNTAWNLDCQHEVICESDRLPVLTISLVCSVLNSTGHQLLCRVWKGHGNAMRKSINLEDPSSTPRAQLEQTSSAFAD